jgi:LPS O-antigen subunit length determinant protein (WzzB/FepE family)
MMNESGKKTPPQEQMVTVIFGQDLASFLFVAWERKFIVATVMFIVMLITILALRFSTYEYTATLKVTAVQKDRQLPSNLAGLASLAGVNLPGGSSGSQLTQYIELLKSRNVSAALASDPYIMKYVFANEWDNIAMRWRPKTGLSVTLSRLIKTTVGMPSRKWAAPNAEMLNRYIDRKIKLTEDSKTNVIAIMLEDKNPAFAIYFVNKIHSATDFQLRQRALDRSRKYVRHLESKLPEITNADHREALVDSLGEQEKALMFASADTPFAAEPIGETTSSFKPTSPNPAIAIPLSALLGLILGLCVAFMLAFDRGVASAVKSPIT